MKQIDRTKGHIVRAGEGYRAQQGSDYTPGISAESVASHHIWFGMITLPPGVRTKAHAHEHHETGLYYVSGGECEMFTGEQLQHRESLQPGDYIFLPANSRHVAVNRGSVPAVFMAVRNEPTARESMVLYPELDKNVP